nr:hypothetical protein [uncultured Tyzzerella sp.]
MDNDYFLEYLENKFLEMKRYIDDCFEERDRNNKIFFDNILELIKVNISKENEDNSKKMLDLIEKLKDTTNTNDVLCKKMIAELKNIDSIYDVLKDEEPNDKKILYTNIFKGVKQFSLQVVITLCIILIMIGAFTLVKIVL